MNPWVDNSIAVISAHPHWAGLFVFLVAASEAIVVVGYIIPGTVILLGVGGIAALGHLPLLPILAWAAAGAIAGDGVSYWLGHRYREALRSRWPFSRYPTLIDRGDAFFHRHGGKSVAIGRFVPVLKPIIPAVAGILGMPPARFYLVNVLSALLWAPAHILPGVLAGASFQLLHGVSPRLAIAALGAAGVLVVTWWLARLLVLGAAPVARGFFNRLYAWSQRRPGSLVQRIGARFDPALPATTALLATLAVLLVAFVGFFAVLEDVLSRDPLVRADHAISTLLQGLRNPWTDPFMIAVTSLGDTAVTGAVAASLIGWLLLRKRWRLALGSTSALVLTAAGIPMVKLLVQVPRPTTMSTGFDVFSFPSGHTTMAAAVYGLAAWILAGGLRLPRRPIVYVAALSWMLLMALSRVYLGAHWPSDVMAGLCLGLLAPSALGALYHAYPRASLHPGLMALVLALVLATVGTWHVAANWNTNVTRYLPEWTVRNLDVSTWRDAQGAALPQRRRDLGGEPEEPLVLQWLGRPQALADVLVAAGWSAPPAWSAGTATGFLRPETNINHLPVLPKMHDGRAAALTLIKPTLHPGSRWVLRAWSSGYQDHADGIPLLLASLVEEQALHPAQLLTLVRSQPASSTDAGQLLAPTKPFAMTEIVLQDDDVHGAFSIFRAAQSPLDGQP